MKKAIAFLAFATALTLSIGCGDGKVVQFNELQKRGDVYVVPETQKPYSGKFITTYYGNVVREAGALKNGKLHGEITTYRENGSIDNVITFANGVLNGKRESYHENGKLMRVGHYKDGNPDGKWEKYDKNGQLIWTIPYENGIAVVERGSFSDQRDGKTYKTVKIGSQTWMAENLNYDANGSKCYKNEESNCQKYGRLYDWNTAMTSCPSGWHLPSSSEWEVLVEIADGYNVAGKKLKAKSGWNWNDGGVSGNGTDEFGFSALPGGGYYKEWARFIDVGNHGYWWRATKDPNNLYNFRMDKDGSTRTYYQSGSNLYSVRCLQD